MIFIEQRHSNAHDSMHNNSVIRCLQLLVDSFKERIVATGNTPVNSKIIINVL
jgi:hypothetical protein